ncbi:MAG TPA: polysaccharide ABC transporter ATP-binding protein [Thermoanaerobaculia bacterium]|nr:polysaccharide ABC transporter ATP-binding protein [Thermoanaerobaculia bacterium]
MNVAIRAAELSKSYRLYRRPIDRFLEMLTPVRRHTVFPALQDVSFAIATGETVGLIGQNGAGKSTLLKLLCDVTQPTSGRLETNGTIASILELGTGFHPEFTGRDNAALNAAILGLSPAEVRERLPLILEFSELGSFLDQPVKTYSSGMYMRLAFSVAVNVDPDILVIDEALAVGDGHFQKKCIDKIREFQTKGKTILFCSHALYYISTLCHRTIWLDQGTVRRIGPSVDVVHEYETFLMERDREKGVVPDESVSSISPIRIGELTLTDRLGRPSETFATGDDIHVRVGIDSSIPSQPIHLMLGVLRAADEMQCFAVGTHGDGVEPFAGRSHYDLTIKLRSVPLLRGDYAVVLFAGDENAMHVFDRKDIRPAFSIAGDRYEIGLIAVSHSWEVASEVRTGTA